MEEDTSFSFKIVNIQYSKCIEHELLRFTKRGIFFLTGEIRKHLIGGGPYRRVLIVYRGDFAQKMAAQLTAMQHSQIRIWRTENSVNHWMDCQPGLHSAVRCSAAELESVP
jgi:hypothetical protein